MQDEQAQQQQRQEGHRLVETQDESARTSERQELGMQTRRQALHERWAQEVMRQPQTTYARHQS